MKSSLRRLRDSNVPRMNRIKRAAEQRDYARWGMPAMRVAMRVRMRMRGSLWMRHSVRPAVRLLRRQFFSPDARGRACTSVRGGSATTAIGGAVASISAGAGRGKRSSISAMPRTSA